MTSALPSDAFEKFLSRLSSAVELESVQDILRMYCRGLAGIDINIANNKDMGGKKIGGVYQNHAAEAMTVYLPPEMNQFDSTDKNFGFFKVASTHQVAHIEFGSFDFNFETSSNRFQDVRLSREEVRKQKKNNLQGRAARLQERLKSQGLETEIQPQFRASLPGAGAAEADGNGMKRAHMKNMGRFFDLFQAREQALDIFTILEDTRLDYRVKKDYPGISPAYRLVQQDALIRRPNIKEMTLQEAMVEFLVRLSLDQYKNLPVPAQYTDRARLIAEAAKRLLHIDASVEDTSEAAIRVFDIIIQMPNVQLDLWDWSEIDVDDKELSQCQLEQLLDRYKEMQQVEDPLPSEDEEDYESPPPVDFRDGFKSELRQLLSNLCQEQQDGEHSGNMQMSREMLEQLLANGPGLKLNAESGQFNSEQSMSIQDLAKEANAQLPDKRAFTSTPHQEREGGFPENREPKTFAYDEWDFRASSYKSRWCTVREKPITEGDSTFYAETVHAYGHMIGQIRRQFEMLMPEEYRKVKHLPDGDDFDLDAVVEAIIDQWAGESPSEKVHWRRDKIGRDVAVVFLLDMSASTDEAIDEARRTDESEVCGDPTEYMRRLRARRGEGARHPYKRIIDTEKEGIVLLIHALETVGDMYGIYGFSGYGRENVEYYVIKDMEEPFSERIKRRIDKIAPLRFTRMGPAIRHTVSKLERQQKRTKLLILISDGRPQDQGYSRYSREGVEEGYAVHDTQMAFVEARRKGILPFALTVDKDGRDYLKTMCSNMGYEVLNDIKNLPSRLPTLYRKLTF